MALFYYRITGQIQEIATATERYSIDVHRALFDLGLAERIYSPLIGFILFMLIQTALVGYPQFIYDIFSTSFSIASKLGEFTVVFGLSYGIGSLVVWFAKKIIKVVRK